MDSYTFACEYWVAILMWGLVLLIIQALIWRMAFRKGRRVPNGKLVNFPDAFWMLDGYIVLCKKVDGNRYVIEAYQDGNAYAKKQIAFSLYVVHSYMLPIGPNFFKAHKSLPDGHVFYAIE